MKHLIFVFLVLISTIAVGQKDKTAVKYSKTITAEELKEHLEVLASDEFLGRETGKEGQKRAEEYLVNYFSEGGFTPGNDISFVQEYEVISYKPEGNLYVNGEVTPFLTEFYFYDKYTKDIQTNEIIFAGYGIESENYNDYRGLDVEGKIIMILEDEPYDKQGNSLVTMTSDQSDWSYSWRKKYEKAISKGARGLITIVKDFDNKKRLVNYYLNSSKMVLADTKDDGSVDDPPSVYISKELANNILKDSDHDVDDFINQIQTNQKPITKTISTDIKIDFLPSGDLLTSSNVLAYIEGTDKKDELIVITAHYDHLGQNGELIFNGADDDGSGTVTLMEIAEAFKKAKEAGHGPRRSILFMPVSGEEKGLLGSKYYSQNPVYPLENTVVNLNIDMIGRHDSLHDNSNYVYLIGSDRLSSDLHEISENANATYTNLHLDYTYNEKDDPNQFYYRSDHYNFAKEGIPVIFYFSGIHRDYHKPTDTVEKIEFKKMVTIARLIFFTTWELANRDERIEVDQPIEWD